MLTSVVGSYPVPDWLRAYPTKPHLRDAIMNVICTQELAGIELVSDGELSRFDVSHPETNGMIDYFVQPLGGVRTAFGLTDSAEFGEEKRLSYRAQPAGVVDGPISSGVLNLPEAAGPLREFARVSTKFAVTSPYMLARVLTDRHYVDRAELCMAIAEVLREQVAHIDVDVVQVDEANVTGNPGDGALAAEAINHVLKGVRRRKAVHLCFGNYGGQTVQNGAYAPLLSFMNALDTDTVVVECARRPTSDLNALAELEPRIGVGLGVIDVKDNEVESADTVARRIDRAATLLGPDRIHTVNPDCGLWMLARSVADAKLRTLAAGRDLYAGATR